MKFSKNRQPNFRNLYWFHTIILAQIQTILQWMQVFKQFLPFLSFVCVCDIDGSKGRAEEKEGGATATAVTSSAWAEGREVPGTPLYGWTILVQLISAKVWTSRRREGSFLQARQKALLCAFHFFCQELVLVSYFFPEQSWVYAFPSHSSLAKPPLRFSISYLQQPIFPVMHRLNAKQLGSHNRASPCLCRRVSQPHISGSRVVWKEHRVCQTDSLSQ